MDTAQQMNQSVLTQPSSPKTSHPFWQHVSKKTLTLIILLFLITAGLLYLAIRQEQPQPKSGESITPTPIVSHAFSTLSFVPVSATGSALQSVAVHVESNKNNLSGAQLNIAYDPKILGNVSVQVGNYFTNPSVLLKTVDATNGQITLVLGIQPNSMQANGNGTLATISYTILPTQKETTTLRFLPKTTLTQEGELNTVLKQTTSLTIPIRHVLPHQPLSASGSAQ